MMEEPIADPLDISKEPEIIKDAQAEIGKLDILVCGGCTEVFHYVEDFQEHKAPTKCKGESTFKCENSEKPQVWGFTLWKAKQLKVFLEKQEENPTSWEIYQRWCKLPQPEKDLWISAGQGLQYGTKMATAKLECIQEEQKKVEKDPLAIDDADIEKLSAGSKKPVEKADEKKAFKNECEKEEFIVEKIVAKRFNPRRRFWEYEVKWKNYEETTFEPLAHLENCKEMVTQYDEKIKAEKEKEKEKQGTPRGRGRPRLNPLTPGQPKPVQKKPPAPSPQVSVLPIATTPGGRPQRSCKQKALNQVKQWCGNISDEDGSGKRPYDDVDDDSDDSFEKKLRLDAESEDTEEENEVHPVRKVTKIVHTYNNGIGKKLPDNVLIPDAKGVVRISQKQLPSLSSGVYIMSKSSGIIKLDAAASKIATSGGQAIVKVNPKVGAVGQTQVKIIKKDDCVKSRIIQMKSSKELSLKAPVTKIIKHVISKQPETLKKVNEKPSPAKVVVKEREETTFTISNKNEDSDDGLEEMEFPTDLPLPAPDSPPGEFTLDPITGKIVGEEDTSDVKCEVKHEQSETIDNIVKLAAADITEEDLKPDPEPIITAPIAVASTASNENIVTTVNNSSTSSTILSSSLLTTPKSDGIYSVVTEPKSGQSILNTAMANSNILQKTLQSPRSRPPPKVINQSVATKPRTSVSALIRNVKPPQPIHAKPKFNISPSNVRNVYSKSNNVTKKIGNTSIYKTSTKPSSSSSSSSIIKTPVQNSNRVNKTQTVISQVVSTSTQNHPKAVINMPSLNVDEEPPVHTAIAQQPNVAQVERTTATAAAATTTTTTTTTTLTETDLSSFTLADGDRPVFITGDDGTIYQVAGQNEDGQTILLTHDSDGQQQCLLVTNEIASDELSQENTATSSQVLMQAQQEPLEVVTDEQPVVAQFIRTEPPSPGGTHKVVVMLPDGECMITQVSPEEYASLELGK